ncbi:DNA (cytosine-5-)-methyltransferase [Pontimicrobium aquaticum]|uniref:Cytosine-specific methyltransferase n=1 Tax=Pontimicrobium aquaticum TaxID=2565367 RepID=A0A4U0EPG9_9FLAO|nr:DNA (cytosine-5-)-methyltransferase [Pontimicrobium aquaticum]TJY33378.1 DNA (cytosine-5-)-methyltransferase [Pontimicrobium aquaticum]
MTLGEFIKKIRLNSALSQELFAKEFEVSFTTINRWENDKSKPRKKQIEQLKKLSSNHDKKLLDKILHEEKPTAYALFAGGGGFHLGMEKYFDILVANDIEPTAEKTHKRNWPNLPFLLEDIRKVESKKLLQLANNKKPDVIFGGPPCQGFSTLGTKMSADPRNVLFNHYVRLVSELNPKAFVFENVKALTTMYKGQFRDNIIKEFSNLGYKVYEKILNTADYGVPQFRERVFIFGTKNDQPFKFPTITHGNEKKLTPYNTVGKAINDLVKKGTNFCENHLALNHSDKVVERYKYIPEGGRLPAPEELPKEIRRKNFGNTYKRLDRKKPSLTMVPGNNAFPVHPTLNRSLTPREAARIQTFPDTHKFVGDRRRQCILVGNAVPPLMAELIGKEVINHLNGDTKLEEADKQVLLIQESKEDKFNDKIIPYKKLKKLKAKDGFIDLFCGAGGFTIGFSKSGWKPLLSADFNKSVAETHKENFPFIPFVSSDLALEESKKLILDKFENEDIGLIVGGPPCQGFSMFGKRRFVNTKGYNPHSDPRNALVYSFLDIVNKIRPRWFLMENVSGLANLDKGLFLKSLIEEFKNIGYDNTEFKILNAADYGVPQKRKRLVIIGNRTGHIIPWPKKKYFETPKDWQNKYRTVGEVITDLAKESSYEKQTCHVPMKHKPLLVERYKHIEEGKKLNVDKLPEHLQKGYRTDKVKNYSHVFKRLHRNQASTTMVPGHNAFPIHPWLNRALTVREAARIQTFPDEIEFMGSRQNQCIQVGNAFPPLLAEILGECIKKAEKNNWFPGEVPKSAWYAQLEKPENVELELNFEKV